MLEESWAAQADPESPEGTSEALLREGGGSQLPWAPLSWGAAQPPPCSQPPSLPPWGKGAIVLCGHSPGTSGSFALPVTPLPKMRSKGAAGQGAQTIMAVFGSSEKGSSCFLC